MSSYKLIAHRGASSEAPENTSAAIKRALEIGVDYIELDVHLSQDGHPIVIHDAVLGRTTRGAEGKRISELTLAEIKKLDAGSWFSEAHAGEVIPTLDEILKIPRGDTGLMIEIKRGHLAFERLNAAVLKSMRAAVIQKSPLLLGSFSAALLYHMHAEDPNLSLAGIVEDINLLSSFQPLPLKRMVLWYKLINPALVNTLHEEGQEVWAFTVDDLEVAKFLLSIGVDGIITNKPQYLKDSLLFS